MKVYCNKCGKVIEYNGINEMFFCTDCGAKQFVPKNDSTFTPQIADDIRDVYILIGSAEYYLKEGNWGYAGSYIEKAFSVSRNNAQVYLCKLMLELKLKTKWDLKDYVRPFDNMESYQKAVQYADSNLRAFLQDSAEQVKTRYCEDAYNTAYNKMTGKDCKQDLLGAAKIFESIAGYRDAADLAVGCINKGKKHQNDIKQMKSRIRKRKISGFVGTLIGIAIVAGIAFGVYKFIEKKTSFETIEFGEYEQDDDFYNGKEDIEWIVVKEEKDRILLVSKYIIDYRAYHNVSGALWEDSDIRQWLNNEFYEEAFDEDEKDRIIKTKVDTDSSVRDRVFLLSRDELAGNYAVRKMETEETDFAKRRGCSPGVYWLRDTTKGMEKNSPYDYWGYSFSDSPLGVRPAIWIEKE